MTIGERIRIHFEDRGQDFLWWDLEDRGDDYSYRVTDCGPFQKWFWTKAYVAADSIKIGQPPLVTLDEKTASPLKYAVTRLERIGGPA